MEEVYLTTSPIGVSHSPPARRHGIDQSEEALRLDRF
jgi:hypothetical protein